MMLAARLGLNVPKVWHLYLPEPAFIIERFGRAPGPEEPLRLHVLDGTQMLNEPSYNKYSSETFPKLKDLIEQCRNKAVARMEVFRWIVFNTMVGNSDSHLKNISFIVDHEGRRVAPFYDLLCTAVYHTRVFLDEGAVWPNEKLASPVAGANFFSDVTFDKLIDTGLELGLSKSAAVREVVKIVGRLADAADEIIAQLESILADPGAPQGAPSQMTKAAERRMLRSIRAIVIADMLRYVRLPVAAAKEPQ